MFRVNLICLAIISRRKLYDVAVAMFLCIIILFINVARHYLCMLLGYLNILFSEFGTVAH